MLACCIGRPVPPRHVSLRHAVPGLHIAGSAATVTSRWVVEFVLDTVRVSARS
jgi:hypothetical protein